MTFPYTVCCGFAMLFRYFHMVVTFKNGRHHIFFTYTDSLIKGSISIISGTFTCLTKCNVLICVLVTGQISTLPDYPHETQKSASTSAIYKTLKSGSASSFKNCIHIF